MAIAPSFQRTIAGQKIKKADKKNGNNKGRKTPAKRKN